MPKARPLPLATSQRPALDPATVRKAQAAGLRLREADIRRRYGSLKHGLCVRTLEDTLQILAEDPEEFQAHLRVIKRTFAPRNQTEERIVRRLAEALWRRLRLYRAQARWEADALKDILRSGPALKRLDADQTRARGYVVMKILLDQSQLYRHGFQVLGEVERLIRALVRRRTGGDPQFKILTRETLREFRELEEMEMEARTLEHLQQGGPVVEKVIKRLAPEWMLRKQPGQGDRHSAHSLRRKSSSLPVTRLAAH